MAGWTAIVRGDEVPVAGTIAVSVADVDLVVWRTADGRACVMDARCPHAHSHLAAEGAVDGDELVCTSHFWRFATDGTACVQHAFGREARQPIRAYPTREREGWVQARLG
jgi:nitrite reductase/ring-hydroxylating ferredoxin subunit